MVLMSGLVQSTFKECLGGPGRQGGQAGEWGCPLSWGLQSDLRLTLCPHKSRPQGLGRGTSLQPFPFRPSPIFSPSLYFSSSTHKGEEKPKKLIEADVLDVPLYSFSFCHSLFLSLPLSLLLPLSLITSGSQAQLSLDSAHIPPTHLSSGPI